MEINCYIADDLLPLYIEDSCSVQSREVLETHLKACHSCREKLDRLKSPAPSVPLEIADADAVSVAGYRKKIKRHRIRLILGAVALCILSALLMSLVFLTLQDMYRVSHPSVFEVEDGVYNLTASPLDTTSNQAGVYVLCTNYKQIQVELPNDMQYDGEILLWNAQYNEPILFGKCQPRTSSCLFTGLNSGDRYRVTFTEDTDFPVLISEGRQVNFLNSFQSVICDICLMLWQ